jgi:hypothetical protein
MMNRFVNFYESRYFEVWEYVPPEVYKQFGEESWWFVNPMLVQMDDALREYFGVPVTINNWKNGGDRVASGFRPVSCKVGGALSQHRFGNASDKIFKGLDPMKVQQEILLHPSVFPFITGIEIGVSWVHTDVRNSFSAGIIKFNKEGRRMPD